MDMMVLYVAWRDPDTRTWFPIGRLSFDGQVYRFVYTKGARAAHFIPFPQMEDLSAVYETRELFPFLENRILSKRRPEYRDFLRWLDVPEGQDDPLTLLARTGGIRETDTLAVFPCPERQADHTYQAQFFSHGLRYLSAGSAERVHNLRAGERLYLMLDPQNSHDPWAVVLRTDDPIAVVGFCPRYFSQDIRLLLEQCNPQSMRVIVERVNPEAPIQLRLFCRLTAPWPEGFRPCTSEFYELLVQPESTEALPLSAQESRV
jgi:HIRAN domain